MKNQAEKIRLEVDPDESVASTGWEPALPLLYSSVALDRSD